MLSVLAHHLLDVLLNRQAELDLQAFPNGVWEREKENEEITEWTAKLIAQRVQKMKESGYVLLEIEPVAGAYIALLAEKILLEKV